MRKIWNGLRYGDLETRLRIGSVVAFACVSVICLIVTGFTGTLLWLVLAFLFGITAIIVSQTFVLEEEDFVAEVNRHGEKETVQAVMAQKNIAGTKADRERIARQEEMAEVYRHYNQQTLQRIKRKYHIRKEHRPIIIDYSLSYKIRECPAFIWRAHNKVFLLLLEAEPRRICISRELIRNMGYHPGVRANVEEEYLFFQKENLITGVFKEYLPDYVDSKVKNDPLKIKNLYTIYPDIQLTNRSAASVMDLLCLNFMPKDKITESDRFNGFFKRIYAANILYRDRVYSILEYKNSVEGILHDMCFAQMPEREFYTTLEQLVKGKLISREYATHYEEIRKKYSEKKEV